MPLIWDNHACIPLRPDSQIIPAQLDRYRASGVNVVSLNICWDGVSPDLALPMAEAFRACVAKHPDRYLLVETVDDIERAQASSRLGIVFDVEGGRALKGDVAMVARFHELGVRWMLLTYNRRNELGGGCLDAENEGLTDFGRAVLDEMCRVGIVPCCSHVSERAAMEVLERSTLPVIFSHSNARAVWNHPRNITDEMIRACARTGGVIGLNGIGPMVGRGPVSVDGVLDHVCHVADLVGPAHVALGLDYDFEIHDEGTATLDRNFYIPAALFPDGFSIMPPEQIGGLAAGLERRGWSGADVAAFLGGNLRRVAEAAWKPRPDAA
jgi:membrane dipeptidase